MPRISSPRSPENRTLNTTARIAARLALCCAAAAPTLGALALAQSASAASAPNCVPAVLNRSSLLPGTSLAVAPLPGSYDALPTTQISFLGAPPAALRIVGVSGTSSGGHSGRLVSYSQGDGASFIPSTPFTPGERVSVRGAVNLGSGPKAFSYSFVVASPIVIGFKPHVDAGAEPSTVQHYQSRPDLAPPAIQLSATSSATAPGYVFVTPEHGPQQYGPMIFDEAGNVVWFDPLPKGMEATNLQVEMLGSQPVLTWWQGHAPEQGFGEGEDVIASSSYRIIGHVRAGNGLQADLHDFRLTSPSTALVTFFNPIRCDLASVHGPSAGAGATDSGFQEIDLRTGLVRRQWDSLDHVALEASYSTPVYASERWPYDYFHINSLDLASGGTLLISSRNTSALYELDPLTGKLRRSIGGKHSSVPLSPGAATAYQHDATLLPNGTISVFDNGADPKVHEQSRGIVVSLNGPSGAWVVAQYVHPHALLAGSQGNIQVLENGDAFIGWGEQPYFSEFNASGALLFDGRLAGSYESYRAYRFAWTGSPTERPALAAIASRHGGPVRAFASWNGDTRTASWKVFAGSSPHHLVPVASALRKGFETTITTPGRERYLAVQAFSASGQLLAVSGVVASTVH